MCRIVDVSVGVSEGGGSHGQGMMTNVLNRFSSLWVSERYCISAYALPLHGVLL